MLLLTVFKREWHRWAYCRLNSLKTNMSRDRKEDHCQGFNSLSTYALLFLHVYQLPVCSAVPQHTALNVSNLLKLDGLIISLVILNLFHYLH